MRIDTYRSSDRRLRTDYYSSGEEARFSIAEETITGTLITEFKKNGEVLNQVCSKTRNAEMALNEYMKSTGELNVLDTGVYERVRVDAECGRCGGEIVRELDLKRPQDLGVIPVVPIFVCKKCGSRFYSLTNSYLMNLVLNNTHLFEKDELREKEKDELSFMNTLQEYIIRIFASKRIGRLSIKGR